jgi:glycosyltransferase involved in cell wall biosynthesis
VETVTYPRRGKLSYFSRLGPIRKALKEFSPQLVHAHYASSFGLWTIGWTRTPVVVSVWGSDIVMFPKTWFGKALLKRIFHYASAITVTGSYLRDQTVTKFPETESRTRIVPFGVDPCAEEYELPELPPLRLCTLKRHLRTYGQDLLIKAVAELCREGFDIRLSLPGDGPENRYYRELTNRLGLSERVSFDGWISRDRLYAYIGGHHALVLPSRSEGFGVAALEASACGRAVIASRVGGLPETVTDGETGVLVDPGSVEALRSAIARLAEIPQELESMGRAGRRFVQENFLWSRSIELMEELYDEILSR